MSIFSSNKPPRVKRSAFNLSHERILSCNFGQIVPIYLEEVVPGDKFSVTTEFLLKLAPMASPAFTRIDNTIHYFFVPHRLVWSGWERWISGTQAGTGKNTTANETADNVLLDFPTITPMTGSGHPEVSSGSLWDYLTCNSFSQSVSAIALNFSVSQLPFRAYQMIYDEYYRDPNVGRTPIIDSHDGYTGYDSGKGLYIRAQSGAVTDSSSKIYQKLLELHYACWRKDYFTSALPWTQRGEEAKLIIDSTVTGSIPATFNIANTAGHMTSVIQSLSTDGATVPSQDVIWNTANANNVVLRRRDTGQLVTADGPLKAAQDNGRMYVNNPSYEEVTIDPQANRSNPSSLETKDGQGLHSHSLHGQPLVQDSVSGALPGTLNVTGTVPNAVVGGIRVNDVRRAFQLQRWLERTARGGYRYIEQILSHFGVYSSDKRLDRPEHLGGGKIPTVIGDVFQTSDNSKTSGGTNTGNRAGQGSAYGASAGFKNKHFEEHGYIMGLLTSRPRAVYQSNMPRTFLKGVVGDRFDFYWPEFAHIGEQQIYNAELFPSNASGSENLGTFGYTPRYHEYRFHASTVHGDFRNTLTFWHQARQFADSGRPVLNNDFLQCTDPGNYRPFYDTTATAHHLWCFMTNHVHALRPLPRFSDPGFMDH